jgi:acetolactate synthase-1/2/3 large subunit
MQLTGAQILIECLKEQGVDTIFGFPGGSVLNIYDELYKHASEIRHILTAHEQGAAHAADGYARSTGKVGVCLATSGPGATNLVTGIATAYMDSVPMVAITGNVTVPLLGKDSFQEVDIAGITMPVTKHNYIVKDVADLADTLREAFHIAREGRPGPVLVDIPKDVTANKAEYIFKEKNVQARPEKVVSPEDIEIALEMIRNADRPFIFVGGGAVLSGAHKELIEFAEKIDAPVCDTIMGKGAFPGTHPRYTGMLGMHGTRTSNLGVSLCDLLIVLGARFSDRVFGNVKKFAPHAKILQVDIDAAEVNKNIAADHAIVADLKDILQIFNAELSPQEHREWIEEVEESKRNYPLHYKDDTLTGPLVIKTLSRLYGEKLIITTEVGQHQMWAAQYFQYTRPRQLLTSGGLGTMGYGLGAAIGAQIANPDKQVVNIAGDGSFRMNLTELATACKYRVPIVEIIMNNCTLGMVRQWQCLFYGERYSQTTLSDEMDYLMIARGFGCETFRIESVGDIEPVLAQAFASQKPVVIDCSIHTDDKVWPMVAPGRPIDDVLFEHDVALS